MKDKVSIIIPIYKVEKYLDECIKSVVNQTYDNLEIILVDDGSPDSCPVICDEWASKDSRIKVIHKENGGVSSSRNAGLDVSSGEYIMFVDSDDTIHPKMVEILYKVLVQEKCDISMCNWKKVSDITSPNNAYYSSDKFKITSFEGDNVFALLFNSNLPLISALWAKLYKSEFFKNIRFPLGKIHEDEKVIPEILNMCHKLSYIDYKMYNNTQRDDSITGEPFSKKRLVVLDILKERIEFVNEHKPRFTDDSIFYFMKISILYYYYAKWAKMEFDVLNKIKQDIMFYYNAGYSNKLVKMFIKHPRILELIIKFKLKF